MEVTPLRIIESLAASATSQCGPVNLTDAKYLIVTCRVTYNASATLPIRVNLKYSPDGNNYDTVAFTYFEPDLTAGSTVQESKLFGATKTGYMIVEVVNQDTTYAATIIKVWASVAEHEEPLPGRP